MSNIQIIHSRKDLMEAFGFLYRNYWKQDFINSNELEIYYRYSYLLPEARVIVSRDSNGNIDGIVTLILPISPNSLPEYPTSEFPSQMYNYEYDPLLEVFGNFAHPAEVSGLAVEEGSSIRVCFELTQFLIQLAIHKKITRLLISVHPDHAKFYVKRFHFDQLTSPMKEDSYMNGAECVVCSLDIEKILKMTDNPMYKRYFSNTIDKERFNVPQISSEDRLYFEELLK